MRNRIQAANGVCLTIGFLSGLCILLSAALLGGCDLTSIPMASDVSDEDPTTVAGQVDDEPTDNQVLSSTVALPLIHLRSQPTDLTAVPAQTEGIQLTWTDNAADEDGFIIQRQMPDAEWSELAVVGADTTSYLDREAAASQTYCYRVLAYNSTTETSPSSVACATIPLQAPEAPSNLTATTDVTGIMLTWQDNSTDEEGLVIQRQADLSAWEDYATTAADVTEYVDEAALPGVSYCYRVHAFNAAGSSADSAEACASLALPEGGSTGGGGGGGSGGGTSTTPPPCMVDCPSSRPNRAFPSAEGFGAPSVGGRGGRVLHVTTLADYNPDTDTPINGSFRKHVEVETGPRIVVFDVGGTILLKRDIELAGEAPSFLTIAGQTAPGGGIQLGQFGINITDGVHDVIVRHIRIRPTISSIQVPLQPVQDFLKKCVLIANNRVPTAVNRNIVFDHCSLEWGMDDSASIGKCRQVTFQWCIFGEGSLYGDVLPAGVFDGDPTYSRGGEASQGVVVGEDTRTFDDFLSVHHCLFIHNAHRNMLVFTQGCVIEFINNFVYNHIQATTIAQFGTITESTHLNFIGNRFQRGSSRAPTHHTRPLALYEYCTVPGKVSNAPTPHCLYVQDNLDDYWRPDSSYPEWAVAAWVHWPGYEGYDGYLPDGYERGYYSNPLDDIYRAETPFTGATIPVTAHAAADLESVLSTDVGATLPGRDTVDVRLINELQTRTGYIGIGNDQQPPHWAADGSVITTGHDPLPYIAIGWAPTDSDRDGMPDYWETSQGLDPLDPADNSGDPDGDGYTNIEEYLNYMAGEE